MIPFFFKPNRIKGLDISSLEVKFLIYEKSDYITGKPAKVDVKYNDILFFMFAKTGGKLKATILTRKGWFFKYDCPVEEDKIKSLSIKIGPERIRVIRKWSSFIILLGALLCYSISYLTEDIVSVALFIAGNSYVIAFLVYFYKSSTYLNWASEASDSE